MYKSNFKIYYQPTLHWKSKTLHFNVNKEGYLMDKIIDILDSIAYEKGLKIEDVENALKEALVKTAEKMVDSTLRFDAEIDRTNKRLKLFQKIEVINNDDERLLEDGMDQWDNVISKENYISFDEAKEIDEDLEIGDFVNYDLEFENMGRNAATI